MRKVNILGTEYTVIEQTEEENPKLKDSNGLCEQYSKEIVIDTMERCTDDVMVVNNLEEFKKKVVRHEIIHAFLGESGLRNNSTWAEDEEMVDWFAIQAPKIFKAIKELEAL